MPKGAPTYDVAIVGAGSAGCVLAARLSEDPRRRVLLLEAGPDYPDLAALPPELRSAYRPTYLHEWGYLGEPGVPGRSFKLPRAKLVGGCSATNAAIALRGVPGDYDEWAAAGNPGWSWEEVLPVFRRLERDLDFAGPWHGQEGPVPVRRAADDELSPAARAFLETCARAGFPAAPDWNAPGALGAGALPANALAGVRQSAAFTHLAAARARPNLEIGAATLVDRLVLRGKRVVGLHTAAGEVAAGRVILAAGAYGSPAILLRSGIGPAAVLRALGLTVVADRPGVGAGLADHPLLGVTFAAAPEAALPAAIFQAGLTLRSSGATSALDLQLLVRAVLPVSAAASPTGATVMLFVALVKPRSRGRLALRSTRPDDSPRIDSGFLTDAADLPRLVEGLRLARRLARAQPFAALALQELSPGPAVGDGEDELARAVLAKVETYHHPVGTCRMGPASDPLAVADARGAVHEIEALSVVDASLMPAIPAANTHLPTVMLAEKIAAGP